VLDDHSRYLLGAEACTDETEGTVRERLIRVFERYGLPDAMITNNGNPWGQQNGPTRLTRLSVWLIRLGIKPLWSRPRHPQTMGKLERLHRTMKAEFLQGRRFSDFTAAQTGLDRWRRHYNHERPHEALGGAVPASRYRMSQRSPIRFWGRLHSPSPSISTTTASAVSAGTAACAAIPAIVRSTSSSPSPSPAN
jgi:transposase InsO family protein